MSDDESPADPAWATSTSLRPTPPRHTRQQHSVLLIVIDGPDRNQSLTVSTTPVTVGSADDCGLILTDKTVSRVHARVQWLGTRLAVEDLGSKNGSYYAGRRLEKLEIDYGDEFQVGATSIKVVPNEEVLTPEPSTARTFGGLVGGSPVMRELYTLIAQVAPSSSTVLLEGETGTGKELVAEEIHRRSGRRDGPFVVFDCGSVPSDLIESALFGHARGAFTGATDQHVGVFEEAEGGTIFLDEIGELKPDLQPALLRVLDQGTIRAVGTSHYRSVDVRVVAATHRNLAAMISARAFREDLYYRLAVLRLTVPSLRDRTEDLPMLVLHFLRRLGRSDLVLSDEDRDRLERHSWPGNVRELRNLVERGAVMSRSRELEIDLEAMAASAGPGEPAPQPGTAPTIHDPSGARIPFRDAKEAAIRAFEAFYLADLMGEFDTVTAAAAAAHMDRKHLRVLLDRYGLRGKREK